MTGALAARERGLLLDQRTQHGERRDDRVAGRVLVEAEQVAGILASKPPALLLHPLEHVAIADRRALEGNALARERLLEAEIAHQRADDAAS